MSTLRDPDAELRFAREPELVSNLIEELLRGLSAEEAVRALDLARARVQPCDGPGTLDPFGALSLREQQVAELVMQGLKSQQIADRLTISIKTVDTHRTRVFKKLGVHSVVDLIRVAAAHKRFP